MGIEDRTEDEFQLRIVRVLTKVAVSPSGKVIQSYHGMTLLQ
jgi:hypothetical protein